MVAVCRVAHAVPARQVGAGFGPITVNNRRVIVQEWLAEAFTMWGIAAIVIAAATADGPAGTRAWVYRAAAGLLVALGTLTAPTGARTPVVQDLPGAPGWLSGAAAGRELAVALRCLAAGGPRQAAKARAGRSGAWPCRVRVLAGCRAGLGEQAAEDIGKARWNLRAAWLAGTSVDAAQATDHVHHPHEQPKALTGG